MGINQTPGGERLNIGFFGVRNAGKSSVVNAVTGQNLALVSDILGTTTDPVQKSMELLPLGPVIIIDTPGIDDEGELGKMRVARTKRMLERTDVAVLVINAESGITTADKELIDIFKSKAIPYVVAFNKSDLLSNIPSAEDNEIYISAKTNYNIYELKELIGKVGGKAETKKRLVGDLIEKNDIVVLVTPIDESAPKGRMILPQQQMIRDVLDNSAINVVTKETELEATLKMLLKKPKLVITDSQAFGIVSKIVPNDIKLTSFSILFARYKGELTEAIIGARMLDKLQDGDTVLISEGCTHHRQCNDIGTVKLPGWISEYCGKQLKFEYTSGGEFPDDLSKFRLIVHCGACMLNEREMKSRIERAKQSGVAITNYGIAIAQIHGILKRSLSPFPKLSKILDD